MDTLKGYKKNETIIVLAGNKIDMQDRVVGRDEINEFCNQFAELKYFECSAYNGQGVEELFDYVIQRRLSTIITYVEKPEIIHDPKDKTCC